MDRLFKFFFTIALLAVMPYVVSGQVVGKIEDSEGKYEGEVKDGKRHGKGTNIGPEGQKYVGEFKDNLADGYGVITMRDGSRYEGEWSQDKPHGKGKATYSNGSSYEGEYRNGVREGQGTYTFPDGLKFVGEFVNDQAAGKGKLYFANGAVYEGGVRKYTPVGEGTSTFPDGGRYTGAWRNGVPDGEGTYTSESGEEGKGKWERGLLTYDSIGGERTEIRISQNKADLVIASRIIDVPQIVQNEADSGNPTQTNAVAAADLLPNNESGGKSSDTAHKASKRPFLVTSGTIKDVLFREAMENGMGILNTYAYDIQNRYSIDVPVDEMKKYLQARGYETGRVVTLKGKFGDYESVDEMEFFPAGTYEKYVYSLLKADYTDPPFEQLNEQGIFYIREGWNDLKPSPTVLWSGSVVNGLIDGEGVGLVREDDRYTLIDGTFIRGFPTTGDILAYRWNKNEIKNTKIVYIAPTKKSILEMAAIAEGDLREAIREYAKATYEDNASIMQDKFERALVLNDNWPGAIPQTQEIRDGVKNDKQMFQDFVQLYGSIDVDPKNLIPRVNEMIDLYTVLESVTKKFDIMDYLKMGVLRFNWDPDGVQEQRDIMWKAQNMAAEYSKDQSLSFRKFYASAEEFLKQKRVDLDKHIEDSMDLFNREMEKKFENMEKYHREHAELDLEKSYGPSGSRVDGLGTFTLEKKGRAQLVNGDFLEYNIVYKSSGAIDHYKLYYSYPTIDSIQRDYDTFEEMVQALIDASKKNYH